jgi:phosphoglycolate phosphatase
MARAETLLFDFDGTLADSLDEMLATYNELAPQLEVVTVGQERARELRKFSARRVLRELGIPLWKVPRIMSAVRSTLRARDHVADPFAGLLSALATLAERGVRVGVVSSNEEPNIRAFFTRHGLAQPTILSSGASLFGKGGRLRRVLARHRLDPARVAYVGDEVRDVEASREAGVRSVAVSWGYAARGALIAAAPDLLVDTPEQLLTVW